MGFKCGIVGLPNVGKSTLFNALTQTSNAQAENYPFCTIDPNIGEVAIPDERLTTLANLSDSKSIIPTKMSFVDIAGLVKGASKGEGLGNKFLANIREMDAIAYVIRCFEDSDIVHVNGRINPVEDSEIVETELMLSDLQSIESRIPIMEKKAKSGDRDANELLSILNDVHDLLSVGKPARLLRISEGEKPLLKNLQLLTSKPVLYVCNVSEKDAANGNKHSKLIQDIANEEDAISIIISAKIESEISQLQPEEKNEYLSELGLKQSGLEQVIQSGYKLLNLITYFTSGIQESRAWTVPKGSNAPRAAREIHTDFEKGFIRAEVVSYEDYVNLGGEKKSKEAGKMRVEGKDYLVEDGDVIYFRFNI
ncbi:MAG: redox-regulated ATPase YchF [Chloroflexi bacterium]|nr:redox-regulated ATPase YchF [Chloroflexota bacterium]|tara:strand:- start:3197 stop:4294 length:1098 start_codon:yes stop_codon:yes gene_type:complete